MVNPPLLRRRARAAIVAAIAIGAIGGLAAGPAAAQFQTAEHAIRYRQGAFQVMSVHFARLSAMANGRQPFDARSAVDDAALVSMMSRLPFVAFGDGTAAGLPNRASPEIWKQAPRFKRLADDLQTEVAKLNVAAKAGNAEALKPAVGSVAQACKACHDDFRGDRSP